MAASSGHRTPRSTSGSWKPTLSGRKLSLSYAPLVNVPWPSSGLLDLVRLDDVAFLKVLVALDPDAAFESGRDFFDVVLEALETRNLAFVDLLVVAQQFGQRATGDLAVLHPGAGDHTDLRDFDGRQHIGAALPDLDEGRLVETLDGALDVVRHVVDDVVAADV